MSVTTSGTGGVSPRDRTREELLRIIRTRADAATRADLIELTGLPRSTVNHAIGRLLSDGRVIEVDVEQKGRGSGSGRPGVRLRAVTSGRPVAAVDFGHSHVHVAVADGAGHTVGEKRVELDVDMHAQEAMDIAVDMLTELQSGNAEAPVEAIVVGVPGPVDISTGLVRSPTILSSWVGRVPASELGARLGVPIQVENDAVLGAYGELRRGAGIHHRDFLYVKASHGIGAGIVINGEPYRGGNGLAGEIGHTLLAGNAEMCRCGNRGCLEAVVSAETIREQILHSHPSLRPEGMKLAQLGELADDATRRIMAEAGRTLGRVLADLCNLLNPSAVVVGGELGAAGSGLVEGINESIQRFTQPATAATLEVVEAQLGVRAEIVGGLELAIERAGARVPGALS